MDEGFHPPTLPLICQRKKKIQDDKLEPGESVIFLLYFSSLTFLEPLVSVMWLGHRRRVCAADTVRLLFS